MDNSASARFYYPNLLAKIYTWIKQGSIAEENTIDKGRELHGNEKN